MRGRNSRTLIGVDRAAENQIIVGSGANLDSHAGQVEDALLGPGTTLLCQNEVRPEASFELLLRAKAQGARTILNLAPAGAVPGRGPGRPRPAGGQRGRGGDGRRRARPIRRFWRAISRSATASPASSP